MEFIPGQSWLSLMTPSTIITQLYFHILFTYNINLSCLLFTPHTSLGKLKNKSTINQRSSKTKSQSQRPKTRRQDFIIGFNADRGRRCQNRPQLSAVIVPCGISIDCIVHSYRDISPQLPSQLEKIQMVVGEYNTSLCMEIFVLYP